MNGSGFGGIFLLIVGAGALAAATLMRDKRTRHGIKMLTSDCSRLQIVDAEPWARHAQALMAQAIRDGERDGFELLSIPYRAAFPECEWPAAPGEVTIEFGGVEFDWAQAAAMVQESLELFGAIETLEQMEEFLRQMFPEEEPAAEEVPQVGGPFGQKITIFEKSFPARARRGRVAGRFNARAPRGHAMVRGRVYPKTTRTIRRGRLAAYPKEV